MQGVVVPVFVFRYLAPLLVVDANGTLGHVAQKIKFHAVEHHQINEGLFLIRSHGHHHTGLRLAKQERIGANFTIRGDVKSQIAGHGRLHQRHKQPTFADVVCGLKYALTDQHFDLLLQSVLLFQAKERRRGFGDAVVVHQILTGRNVLPRSAQLVD